MFKSSRYLWGSLFVAFVARRCVHTERKANFRGRAAASEVEGKTQVDTRQVRSEAKTRSPVFEGVIGAYPEVRTFRDKRKTFGK